MKFLQLINPFLIIPVLGLSGISLFIISSTNPGLFTQQLIAIIFGIALYIFFANVDYRIWGKFSVMIYALSIFFLAVSLLGPNIRGSHRWIDIGITSIQPSELIKPFLIIFFAYQISREKILDLKTVFKQILFFLPIGFMIFRQPDLGNVIIYLIIFVSILLVAGIPWKYIAVSIVSFGLFLPVAWIILRDYQKLRILSFLNPYLDPAGAGYNALQAVISIGSGQIFGLGLGRGTQSRLLFLPEFHTDFIFASLAEELGFIGGSIIISFYVILLGFILKIAFSTEDNFGKYLAVGIMVQIFIQVFINIGMNLGIMPITGITLPLVSYGGSSVLSTFIELGLIISISKTFKKNPLVIR
jgi:rod shape determining protein RodA